MQAPLQACRASPWFVRMRKGTAFAQMIVADHICMIFRMSGMGPIVDLIDDDLHPLFHRQRMFICLLGKSAEGQQRTIASVAVL